LSAWSTVRVSEVDQSVMLDEARRAGQQAVHRPLFWLQREGQQRLRRSLGVTQAPPPPCDDPSLAYVAPDSVVRQIHADLPSMLIGGLASLLLQTLHPLAMAGVADHSRYQHDPLGRLERTATFVGVTTFGTRLEAQSAIDAVRRIHRPVIGTFEGAHYSAQDPALLTWIHAAEVSCFLTASRRYGPHQLAAAQCDAYVADMAPVALDLGATEVPRTVDELDRYLDGIRPELRATNAALTAKTFILKGVRRWPHERATYGVLLAAAQGTLPSWARRELRLPAIPGAGGVVKPAASLLCSSLRLLSASPQEHRERSHA